MHCRIGCRLNGGFIECLDPSGTINVAGVDKNRSRLTNGDLLKIGTLQIDVVIPQVSEPTTLFDIAIEDFASADTADAPDITQPEADFFDETTIDPAVELDQSDFEFLPSALSSNSNPGSSEADQPEPSTPSTEIDATREQESSVGNSSSDKKQTAESDNDQAIGSDKATSSDDDSKSPSSAESDKPVFEFDSVEPSDIKLTEEDLDVIENMTGSSLVLKDFDGMVKETFPEHIRDQSTTKETTDTRPQEIGSNSNSSIPTGSDSGKCYHWNGKAVLPTVELIEQRNSEMQCFRVQENGSVVPSSFAEIRQAVASKDGPKIFVLTKNSEDELNSFFTTKPWNDRLGHPRALSMFLTVLPAKNIERLFAKIDACILVQSSDTELVRLSGNLDEQSR